MTSSTATIFD